jgi:hypothetical protein
MEEKLPSDPLRQVAESLVAQKPGINDAVKEKMIDELVVAMERSINTELLARLDNSQAQEFLDLLNTNPTDEQTVQFFKDKNVDIDKAVAVALQTFKDSYIG